MTALVVCFFFFFFPFQVLAAAEGITRNPKRRDSPCSALFVLT